MSISHHGPSACWNMLKLPGQGESQKCGCWAYMARDWCFSQRTGMGGLMLVFSWKHVWNLTFLWHMFGRMHHHAVCVGPPPDWGKHVITTFWSHINVCSFVWQVIILPWRAHQMKAIMWATLREFQGPSTIALLKFNDMGSWKWTAS